ARAARLLRADQERRESDHPRDRVERSGGHGPAGHPDALDRPAPEYVPAQDDAVGRAVADHGRAGTGERVDYGGARCHSEPRRRRGIPRVCALCAPDQGIPRSARDDTETPAMTLTPLPAGWLTAILPELILSVA